MQSWFKIHKLFNIGFLLLRPMTLGARVFVQNDKDEILLVRHTYVSGWYMPGGGTEAGDTLEQTAQRELFEETGLVAEPPMQLFSMYQNRTASRRDHVALFKCQTYHRETEFKPNMEIAEIGFFSLDNLPEDTTPGTLRRLAELFEGKEISPYW